MFEIRYCILVGLVKSAVVLPNRKIHSKFESLSRLALLLTICTRIVSRHSKNFTYVG